MSNRLVFYFNLFLLAILCGGWKPSHAQTSVTQGHNIWTIGNDYFQRVISVENGILSTVEIEN